MSDVDPLATEPEPHEAFLRACARVYLDAAASERLRQAAREVQDWTPVVPLAEFHGLAPLVRAHVKAIGMALPASVGPQLAALAVRHRAASLAHTRVLLEIVDALDAAGVPHVVLKGAALAFDIYPQPELRPRKDIDVLVSPEDAPRTSAALRALGFSDAAGPLPSGSHHHLPGLVKAADGHSVSVEIHVDAISGDQPGSLTLRGVSSPPRTIRVDGRAIRAFGHVDMLRHLASHLLEPAAQTRLIGAADLVAYAERHAAEIDWVRLAHEFPRTSNVITLLDYLVPLPDALGMLRPPAGVLRPMGIGRNFPLLSTVRFTPGRRRSALASLLCPSEWWMHAYYGVPPGRRLAPARWTRHVPRLLYWRLRRA